MKYTIDYPSAPSEFEVQAFLYWELKRMGFNVRGEVHGRHDGKRLRFDLVIFCGKRNPVRIIEVKKHTKRFIKAEGIRNQKMARDLTDQVRRYEKSGVPVDVIGAMREAEAYIEKVRAGGPRYFDRVEEEVPAEA